jgi:superfamily II DNA or RNA helicase
MLISAPTGAGKSRCMLELFRQHSGRRICLYTHRRLLLEQLSQNMSDQGLEFGIRASGHDTDRARNLQLCMVQTEHSQKGKRGLHDAEIVVIDEAHVIKASIAESLVDEHRKMGATVVGFTATPVDLGHMYDELYLGASNSDLRACGAHLPCYHYAPDTIDMKGLRRMKTGEFFQGDVIKAIMTPTIIARVIDNYKLLNPEQKPSILFAPGVAESRWFAEELTKCGIPAGHIDAESIWFEGKTKPNSTANREAFLTALRSGEMKVACNRFLLREGIDVPELYHAIMATCFGSIQSYLQAGGRLLRSHSSLSHVILQDHGNNVLNHGSLNADREWSLGDCAAKLFAQRVERMREQREEEPIICSQCFGIRSVGPRCPICGHVESRRVRRVIQLDGTLKLVEGKHFKPLRIDKRRDSEQRWLQIYNRARNSKSMTFRQARSLYAKESGDWSYPSAFLRLMPLNPEDMVLRVRDVPKERLR